MLAPAAAGTHSASRFALPHLLQQHSVFGLVHDLTMTWLHGGTTVR